MSMGRRARIVVTLLAAGTGCSTQYSANDRVDDAGVTTDASSPPDAAPDVADADAAPPRVKSCADVVTDPTVLFCSDFDDQTTSPFGWDNTQTTNATLSLVDAPSAFGKSLRAATLGPVDSGQVDAMVTRTVQIDPRTTAISIDADIQIAATACSYVAVLGLKITNATAAVNWVVSASNSRGSIPVTFVDGDVMHYQKLGDGSFHHFQLVVKPDAGGLVDMLYADGIFVGSTRQADALDGAPGATAAFAGAFYSSADCSSTVFIDNVVVRKM
jgi:hypothetical protein